MTSAESPRATGQLEIGPAFSYGWKVVTSDVRPWVLIALALLVGSAITTGLGDALSGTPIAIFFIVAGFVIESILGFLGAAMALAAVEGERVEIPKLEGKSDGIVTYLVASLIVSVIITIGFVLLIVPGFIALTALFAFGFFVVEGETDPAAAVRASRDLTRGYRWQIFGAGLVAIGVNLLGVLALGVGLLISIPVTIVAAAHLFMQLHGRPIAPPPESA